MSDGCPFCGKENKHLKHQIANLTARLDEATRLLRYQEERNHSLNERLNEAEDRLEAWREYGRSRKETRKFELLPVISARESAAIAALKEAGEWEE